MQNSKWNICKYSKLKIPSYEYIKLCPSLTDYLFIYFQRTLYLYLNIYGSTDIWVFKVFTNIKNSKIINITFLWSQTTWQFTTWTNLACHKKVTLLDILKHLLTSQTVMRVFIYDFCSRVFQILISSFVKILYI